MEACFQHWKKSYHSYLKAKRASGQCRASKNFELTVEIFSASQEALWKYIISLLPGSRRHQQSNSSTWTQFMIQGKHVFRRASWMVELTWNFELWMVFFFQCQKQASILLHFSCYWSDSSRECLATVSWQLFQLFRDFRCLSDYWLILHG